MNAPLHRVAIRTIRDQHGTAVVADASRVSGADFVAMFAPRKSRLTELCEQLFIAARDNDREALKSIHAEIRLLNPRARSA
jgi:hypothetical protein